MARKLINSFRVSGFRGINELLVPQIGRVNLVVGKNSCGKTSILEAIQLYTGRGTLSAITSVLAGRNDVIRRRLRDAEQFSELYDSFQNLFYAPNIISGVMPTILLETLDPTDAPLSIRLARLRTEFNEEGRQLKLIDDLEEDSQLDGVGLAVSYGDKNRIYPFDRSERYYSSVSREFEETEAERYVSVPTSGLAEDRMGRLWDRITLTESEDEVVKALRIISPKLERISLIGSGSSRSFMVRLKGYRRPMPLRVMGDGLSRLMGIALALVSAQNGVLLVDEIENGLHYSVQESVWNLIFQTAHRLNIQVFAATHSWDCISAFQKASIADKHEDAFLIRVQESAGSLRVIQFDENELSIAAHDRIEVR